MGLGGKDSSADLVEVWHGISAVKENTAWKC